MADAPEMNGRLDDEELDKLLKVYGPEEESFSPESSRNTKKWLVRMVPVAILGGVLSLFSDKAAEIPGILVSIPEKVSTALEGPEEATDESEYRRRVEEARKKAKNASKSQDEDVFSLQEEGSDTNSPSSSTRNRVFQSEMNAFGADESESQPYGSNFSGNSSESPQNDDNLRENIPELSAEEKEELENMSLEERFAQLQRRLEEQRSLLMSEVTARTSTKSPEYKPLYDSLTPQVAQVMRESQLLDGQELPLDFAEHLRKLALDELRALKPEQGIDQITVQNVLNVYYDLAALYSLLSEKSSRKRVYSTMVTQVSEVLSQEAFHSSVQPQQVISRLEELLLGNWFDELRAQLDSLKYSQSKDFAAYERSFDELMSHYRQFSQLDALQLESAMLNFFEPLKAFETQDPQKALQLKYAQKLVSRLSFLLTGNHNRQIGEIPQNSLPPFSDAQIRNILQTMDQVWTQFRIESEYQSLSHEIQLMTEMGNDSLKANIVSGLFTLPGNSDSIIASKFRALKDHPQFSDLGYRYLQQVDRIRNHPHLTEDQRNQLQTLETQIQAGFR